MRKWTSNKTYLTNYKVRTSFRYWGLRDSQIQNKARIQENARIAEWIGIIKQKTRETILWPLKNKRRRTKEGQRVASEP